MIADADIPVVETWDYVPEREPLQIGFSHYAVGVTAARYLHGQGYRRIAFVHNSVAGDFSAMGTGRGVCRDAQRTGRAALDLRPRRRPCAVRSGQSRQCKC